MGFVTRRWHERWVLPQIDSAEIFEALRWKPFFLLISVDAPVTLRWERFKERHVSYTPCTWFAKALIALRKTNLGP